MKPVLSAAVLFVTLVATAALASSEPATNALAYQAIQQSKWTEAESILRQGLIEQPNDAMKLLNLAYVLQQTDRRDEAAAVYERVLQLDRDPLVATGPDAKVRSMRAKLLARKGIASIEDAPTK